MGGNLSRVNNEGRTTHVANATAIPSAYNNTKPENRVPNYPSCAPYPPSYRTPTNFNYSNGNSNNNSKNSEYDHVPRYSEGRPVASVTVADANRVIAFHSAARWREYFEASKHSNKLVIIYFTATWCGPCKYMEPTIKELASKYNDIEIVKVDVDELFNVSRDFGVQTMPTFLFMKRGKQIDKVIGANKEDLQIKIEKHRF